MQRKIICALLSTVVISGPVFAAPTGSSYVGLQYSKLNYEAEYDYDYLGQEYDLDLEAEPDALIGRVGYFVTDYFALEARVDMGLSDEEVTVEDYKSGVDVGVDYMYGLYGIGYLPLADTLALYALLGYTGIESQFDSPIGKVEETESDFSYGVGAEVNFTPTMAGSVEYVTYLDESDQYDFTLTAISAGLSYRF
ncbi:porin family protein [Modicisalibacter xianhensis]|uniref:Opacity protein n=1 Tax=Modicisalibacter xianhensis TaxID=442341 RepID=A0A1I2ZLS5_9GAMM|nr:porin family protein [Halomonas xianhensis]SFH38778.1 Opacity protein [Halomonas xianhensis]